MTEPKQAAFVSDASGRKETAPQTFLQDLCFLCSGKIDEAAPRQFYSPPENPGMLMLAHTPCLLKFKANGAQWPPPEPAAAPIVQAVVNSFGDGTQQVKHGNAKLAYDAHQVVLLCNAEISSMASRQWSPT